MENPAVADGGYNNDRALPNVRVVEHTINHATQYLGGL
jgi:hypothetical protein